MRSTIEKLIKKNKLDISRVGFVTRDKKLVMDDDDKEIKLKKGYEHFENK